MKIISYYEKPKCRNNPIHYGVVLGDVIIPASITFTEQYPSLRDVLAADQINGLAQDIQQQSYTLPLSQIAFVPPVYNPQRIICVGINYPKRYPLDNPAPPPDNIILFAKLDGTLVGHNDELELPCGNAAQTFDYEGEIVVIIGKGGRHIKIENAFDHVAGYTVLNDGSVREWQKHSVHAGKNFANSGACGPWIVTADEIDDPLSLKLTTRLNGEIVQDTTANEMVFSIPQIITYISNTIDLRPGDIIATGSPEGSGGSRRPPRYLRAGDQLDISVSQVGVLSNKVGREC